MKHTCSLKGNFRFRAVYDGARSAAAKNVVLFAVKNSLGVNRLGLTASKKVGNAVKRNRARRVIRESYRLLEHRLLPGYDLVILARPGVFSVNDVLPQLERLLRKCGIMNFQHALKKP